MDTYGAGGRLGGGGAGDRGVCGSDSGLHVGAARFVGADLEDPAFDHVLAPGKGTIVANVFNKVRVEVAGECLELETPFWAYVSHRYNMQLVLVTWFHNRPQESHILITLCMVDKGTLRVWKSVRWAMVVGLGPSAMALAEHANGALARWKVEVASRQAKKKDAMVPEDDTMSMDTDDTAARRLGCTRVPRTGKGQGHALTAEALEAAAVSVAVRYKIYWSQQVSIYQ